MQSSHLSKALILALFIVVVFITSWEIYWRNKGYVISYNDDKVLWTQKRKDIYRPINEATVFSGGSRIKFDLDIPTWEKLTGEKVIQLAFVGTTARPILKDLAADEKFKGKLVMDVTEYQFFSIDTGRTEKSAKDGLKYFYGETPAQQVSASINKFLESKFVFLEEGKFGMNALLSELQINNRKAVLSRPRVPKYLGSSTAERQSFFTSIILNDTALQSEQKRFWARSGAINKTAPVKSERLEVFFKDLKKSIDMIRARGGQVVFVRPPSSGSFLEREKRDYSREQYWDQLLECTQTRGYYFADNPNTAKFICIEESHLAPWDAVAYTTELAKILKEKDAWFFHSSTAKFTQQ